MLAAFEGWNDAADAASNAIEHLEREWQAQPFAAIDPEDYYDYQVNRPTVRLVDGVTRRIEWPTTRLSVAKTVEPEVVLLRGLEPNMRWRAFCDELVDFAHELDVQTVVCLAALLRDDHEAEEVVQEALLRAFQHRHLLATEDDLMAWLTVVTGRLIIDRLRVRGRAVPVAEVPPQSQPGRDTADVVVARDEARLALDALEAMPGRQASVLWAREVEGLTYDEIGERFAMSEPSVRSLLHRARRTLRREYADRGGTLPAVGLIAFAPWLRGLRAANRVRHVARRGASAAAVAATGLAIATVLPFGAQQSPAT